MARQVRGHDDRVVKAFGEEWDRFSNEPLSDSELSEMFEAYMAVFPWDRLPDGAVGFDAGCGSGRWAKFVAPRVGHLHCVDASNQALAVARRVLRGFDNVDFRHETLGDLSIKDSSCDFGYSLGVLHHISETEDALAACVAKLRPGARSSPTSTTISRRPVLLDDSFSLLSALYAGSFPVFLGTPKPLSLTCWPLRFTSLLLVWRELSSVLAGTPRGFRSSSTGVGPSM